MVPRSPLTTNWSMTVGPKNHLRNFVNNWFHSVGGQEIPAVDLRAHVNMVTDAQNLTRDNILKYAGFFHGGINDGLEVSPKLAQRSLRLNWMSMLIWWLILRSLNIAHLGSAHICHCLQWMGISHFQNRILEWTEMLSGCYNLMILCWISNTCGSQ